MTFADLTEEPSHVRPADHAARSHPIRVAHRINGELRIGSIELLEEWKSSGGKLWIDILSTNRGEIEPLLEERFGFHELAAEDSLSENSLPKYDAFSSYDFFVFRAINMNVFSHDVDTLKLAAFLGPDFLITVYQQHLISTDTVWTRLPQDARILDRGCDFLLYSILDVLVDLHFPLIDRLETRVDEIHESIFEGAKPDILDELLHLKRDLNVLRRHSLPQRELFNQISRGDSKFIKNEHLIYFRDLYDHMFRISESIDVERDLIAGTMDAHLSIIANKTNEIMKVLTIFSSILLPMNFIAGVYGMNFEHMPELNWKFGYAFAFFMMVMVAAIMLAWFQRKGWLWPSAASAERRRKERRSLKIGR